MTEADPPSSPDREQLREEAGFWFTRMRGPDADAHREEFEAWLARGALQRAAYSRIAETFSIGKGLDESDLPPAGAADHNDDDSSAKTPHLRRNLALAAGMLAILLCVAVVLLMRPFAMVATPRFADASETVRLVLATRSGEQRRYRLEDGSSVSLGADSLVDIAFTAGERRLQLLRGSARFDVAHERRPFAVAAAGGLIIAHGTLFDVAITPDHRVQVKLLRGAIEVRMPPPHSASGSARVAMLHAGEAVAFDAVDEVASNASPASGTEALIDFDRARLGDIVARANQASAVKIVLADPSLAGLAVSGTFRIDDARALAAKVALMFDLDSVSDGPSRVVLKPRRGAAAAN